MAESLTIRQVLELVANGQIRIPAFQRGFVWDYDQVAYLMDSIYKRFPFGSLLFWRTKEQLRRERNLGFFELPEPRDDYPVDYVLDGQQRITSIFSVFQSSLEPVPASDDSVSNELQNIYFDLSAPDFAQETQFLPLTDGEVDLEKHFPLNCLFDSKKYREATEGYSKAMIAKIDAMQENFKEVLIPFQLIRTEDKAAVAIIFERINRQGVPLNTLQLLSAWTWSEEFQLQEQFDDLAEQLAPFGFEDLGTDTNLILRCCSSTLR